MRDQRCGVSAPENKAEYIDGQEADPVKFAGIEGIGIDAKTGSYPIDKPGGVEGRDVGAAAGGDNFGGHCVAGYTI